jgi:uncharacterized protein YjbI with pentapeptide repeats
VLRSSLSLAVTPPGIRAGAPLEPKPPPWDRCSASTGCRGAAIPGPGGRCLAHLERDRELGDVLASVVAGAPLDGRGVRFDAALLARILATAPRTRAGRPRLERADFTEAAFANASQFDGVNVGNKVSFERASFGSELLFDDAVFADGVSFRGAEFGANASFRRATFGHDVSFAGARFGDGATFKGAHFGDKTSFVDRTVFGQLASFDSATFGSEAHFDEATFGHRASFRKATFAVGASLRKTIFGNMASFEGASFAGETSFSRSSFGDDARFSDASFGDGISFREVRPFGERAGFQRVSFGDRAWFSRAEFGPGASFAGATFDGMTGFSEVVFAGRSKFEDTTFAGQVRFDKAVFRGRASFRLATFERARNFGPLVALGLLTLDQASFLRAASLQVSADRFTAVRASFPEGVALYARWAQIGLDLAEFGAPSLLTASAPFLDLDEDELANRLESEGRGERSSLYSARGADLAGLIVSNVDLSACRFVGAHNLERLRLEGDSGFATTPRWRGTRRQIIAEEQEWRASRAGRGLLRWQPPDPIFPIERVERMRILKPHEIAVIYRALRKGREDEGDAPGAGDFYYGEMEMRRHDERTSHAERTIIWLYWLVSGYGLRGLRALLALLATIVIFALLFWWVGFTPRVDLTRALLFSAESTSSLFRVPETPEVRLTRVGEVLQIVLRLLGPLFFGLALLSLRGRVKR